MSDRMLRLAGSLLLAAGLARGATPSDTGVNGFGSALYGRLADGEKGNFVVSPFSIHAAMSMVTAGAARETEAQLVRALQLPAERDARAAAWRGLRNRLEAVGAKADMTLEVANRVWVQTDFPLLPDFSREGEKTFGAGFASADFKTRADDARLVINGWVEQKTRDRIRDLIPAGMLTPLTRMVLVNAVYFYGTWQTSFDAARTQKAPFHVAPNRDVQADLMQARLKGVGYREGAGLEVCELPYRGRDVAMLVLLPAAGGLAALEKRLAEEGVAAVIGTLAPREVEVGLPRFKIEAQFGLREPLEEVGIRDAFNEERADFSGMTGDKDLFISTVVHKAFIEVNEKGTEAAAATGVIMAARAMRIDEAPAIFRADRPFLFALRERTTGTVLFVGRVLDPTA